MAWNGTLHCRDRLRTYSNDAKIDRCFGIRIKQREDVLASFIFWNAIAHALMPVEFGFQAKR